MSWKNLLKWGFFAALLLLGARYLWVHSEDFSKMVEIRPVFLPFLLLTPVFFIGLLGILNKTLVEAFGIRLTFLEWFGLQCITNFGNYLLPLRGGAGTRAAYLKMKHNFPISSFLSTMGATYLINTFLAGAIASVCIVWIGDRVEHWGMTLTLLLGASFGLLLLMIFPFPFRFPDRGFFQKANLVFEGWARIQSDRALILKVATILIANYLLIAIHLDLCYSALSIPIPFVSALAIATVLGFTRLISITPANLGIQEFFTALLSELVGVGFDQGLAVSILARVTMAATTFILGPLFGWLVFRNTDLES
ncbi:MAG: flippase-like domain-containing protein [Candidatus Omnitrophica bacterium]|nr:flippase-like domain-containing protein [Candidatus Omnitrophota bacterium]